MLRKALFIILTSLILSSCNGGINGFFKKSANNKFFDRKGFHGGKRAPLYNKKYINKAKQNIANSEVDDEDDSYDDSFNDLDEYQNISQKNRAMYRQMLEDDYNRQNKKPLSKSKSVYPILNKASDRISSNPNNDPYEIREEIEQIKMLLDDAKREIASNKCPSDSTPSSSNKVNKGLVQKVREDEMKHNKAPEVPFQPPVTQKSKDDSGSVIIDPVKSI